MQSEISQAEGELLLDRLALTLSEACKVTGLGRNKMLEEIHSGKLKHKRVGKRILIPKVWLEEWLLTEELDQAS